MFPPGVLSGLRVIELGQVLAGPFVGAIFADLGAEVIKIERPDGGDDARRMGPAFRNDDAMTFHIFNRGKKSATLDMKSPEGRAAFEHLAASADIVVHNLRPGVPEALGIDGPSLTARKRQIQTCKCRQLSVSCGVMTQDRLQPHPLTPLYTTQRLRRSTFFIAPLIV